LFGEVGLLYVNLNSCLHKITGLAGGTIYHLLSLHRQMDIMDLKANIEAPLDND